MRLWTMRKSGLFSGKPTGNNHCGTGDNMFRFEIKITTSKLDPQGFVLDGKFMAEAVAAQNGVVSLSCEETAELIARRAFEAISKPLQRFVTRIEVMVGPSYNTGDATFEWPMPAYNGSELIDPPAQAPAVAPVVTPVEALLAAQVAEHNACHFCS